MIAIPNDKVSSHKDKGNVACCVSDTEVMSNMEPLEIDGCKVYMHFAADANPQVRISIANLLIEAFLKRRETE